SLVACAGHDVMAGERSILSMDHVASLLPSRVVIREVGLRDGLQSIKTILPTERKLEWIRDAYGAGFREIEVGSFVPAKLLPQLADTADLVAEAKKLTGLTVSVLVPNLRGAERAIDAGVDCVGLADTVGYADPRMVRELFERAFHIAGDRLCGGHFHDTRGLAMANVYAALELGVSRFDASLAGIGGCPHAPGASGNVSTEDLAYMLGSMGLHTGIDIEQLLALRASLAEWLSTETLHGTLWRAGLPKTFLNRRAAL